ncbi:hypothetical protein BY996DRAFT_6561411 [Phakopsora pachyrhizi]|uniref:Uncharacterized protein n=1 Tax=Phakopsora pachyrhizi TaxID=170000 RepID=A0AAV0BSZ3_PHAPC|nr:hypothetical protein BY996DRAFT_6561411 [Phakopsora pachyrhizi]CAH7690595.1 hypothetical protein PPACK8108_LOCUS25990 [Phakopsora pachyrhizi]
MSTMDVGAGVAAVGLNMYGKGRLGFAWAGAGLDLDWFQLGQVGQLGLAWFQLGQVGQLSLARWGQGQAGQLGFGSFWVSGAGKAGRAAWFQLGFSWGRDRQGSSVWLGWGR